MPTNKNALTRYKYLDEMLSDRHHFYDIHDLTKKCNEKLIDAGLISVGVLGIKIPLLPFSGKS